MFECSFYGHFLFGFTPYYQTFVVYSRIHGCIDHDKTLLSLAVDQGANFHKIDNDESEKMICLVNEKREREIRRERERERERAQVHHR